MTSGTMVLMGLTGLALVFSMAGLLGLIVLHHNAQSAYDNYVCADCASLHQELARQARAMSQLWRRLEDVDGGGLEVPGSDMRHEEVGAGH